MTVERIARLEEIGFEWSISDKVPWDTRYEELKQYKEKYGTCRVPQVKNNPYKRLANWVTTQRQGYSQFMKAKGAGEPATNRKGMTEERIALLEKIGFEWSVRN